MLTTRTDKRNIFFEKLIFGALGGFLYWFDCFLAKGRRAIRRVSITVFTKVFPKKELYEALVGKGVADLTAPLVGEYSTCVLDIGARWGGSNAWWNISPIAKLVGFDPDPAECKTLNEKVQNPKTEIYVPLALGAEKKTETFYLTRQPACSSVYEPDRDLIARYPVLKEIEPLSVGQVEVKPLDDWWRSSNKPEVSFIKIDTQGYELEILRGAKETLENTLGLEVEVEFSGLYKGQPLFHEVDAFLRESGFVVWSLHELCHYQEFSKAEDYKKRMVSFKTHPRFQHANGRLFWGSAVYFRDYKKLAMTVDNQRKFFIYAALFESLGDFSASSMCLENGLRCNPKVLNETLRFEIEKKYRSLRGEITGAIRAPLRWYPQMAFHP